MKKVILFIDSSDNQRITVSLDIGEKKHEIVSETANLRGSQVILPLISQVLKQNKLTLKDITGVMVNPGPGSYTGLRVGVSIGNALAFTLGIPINNLPKGEYLKPIYE